MSARRRRERKLRRWWAKYGLGMPLFFIPYILRRAGVQYRVPDTLRRVGRKHRHLVCHLLGLDWKPNHLAELAGL